MQGRARVIESQSTGRARAAAVGLILGLLLFAVDWAFGIRPWIVDNRVLPPFLDTLLPTIVLPMVLGAVAVAIDGAAAPQRAIRAQNLLIGALAAVAWWAVPLLLLGVLGSLFITTIGYAIAYPIQRIVEAFSDEVPFAGLYVGAAIAGGAYVGGLSALAVAFVRALLDRRPRGRRAIAIGVTVGVLLGMIYGVLWTAAWVNAPSTWLMSPPR